MQIKNGRLKNHKEREILNERLSRIYLLPLVLMIIIPATLTGLHVDQIPERLQSFWISKTYVDMYAHHSAIATIILAGIMLLIAFFTFKSYMYPNNKSQRQIIVLILLFFVLTIMSSIFSIERDTALWGSPGRYEGLFVQAAYIITALYILIFIRRIEFVLIKKYTNYALIVLSTIISIFTIAQLLGIDLIFEGPISKLLNRGVDGDIIRTDGGVAIKTFLSLTFGNSNYVGSYVALILPMLTVMAVDKKNPSMIRLVSVVLIFLSSITLFLSRSRAGLIGIVASLLLLLIIECKAIVSNKKILISTVILVPVFFSGIYLLVDERSKGDIRNTFRQAIIFFQKTEGIDDPYYGLALHEIDLTKEKVVMNTVAGQLILKTSNSSLYFEDSMEDKIANQKEPETNFLILDEPFRGIKYELSNPDSNINGVHIIFEIEGYPRNDILIAYDKDKGFYTINPTGVPIELVQAPYWGFEGKEKLGSGRGYIWSRSIPLLKDTIIKGVGPDNYLYAFPQHDYWAKVYFNSWPRSWDITDKPHNMYLQWGINNGVVAILALLAAFGIFVVKASKDLMIYRRGDANRLYKLGILLAVAGYLATGMFNDSVTSIAPIFWIFFGLGVSLLENNQEEVKDSAR